MKKTAVFLILLLIIAFSCTDRDDNLEGIQIRVQNGTEVTFVTVNFDSLVFADVQAGELPFYQKFSDSLLPSTIVIASDSLTIPMSLEDIFIADSVEMGLYTYRILEFSAASGIQLELLRD